MVFAEWQVGQVLWSMIWFTMFFLWIWVVVTVFMDIFRSQDMGGFAKGRMITNSTHSAWPATSAPCCQRSCPVLPTSPAS